MGLWALFAFFSQFSETLQWRSGKLLGIYLAQWVLANARLGFGGPSQFFTGAKNLNFRQNFRQHSELAAYYSKTGRHMENLQQ